MSNPTQFAAQLLSQDHRAIAELVLARLEKMLGGQGGAPAKVSAAWTTKIETHLQTLAACLHFTSPLLIADYIQWGSITPEKNPPFPNEVEVVFRLIEEIVRAEFPKEVGDVVSSYLKTSLSAAAATAPESPPPATSELQQKYLSALLSADRSEALRLAIEAVHSGVGVGEFYLEVLQPSQREIGRLWQNGAITVAQEHYCTAATQFVMSQLQPYFLHKSRRHKTLIASCVGDELHEVGLRIVADIFEMEGWNTIYFGANTPADCLAKSLIEHEAMVLAISTTMTRHLFALAEVISVVRSTPECQEVKVIVGGYPFNVDPFLWRRIGADGGAREPSEAVKLANRYVAKPEAEPTQHAKEIVVTPLQSRDSTDEKSQNEWSQLNNELTTAHRQLHKANLELQHLRELSEQKTAELQTASRRKDEFLAMLAHELRGPLAPMNHALTILGMDQSNPSIIAEARETIQRQVRRMSHLISDLLDASRIAHGKIDLKMARVNLSEIVKQALEIALPHVREKSHDLHLEEIQPSIHLMGDEIRLIQVFANLLTNASKYTEEGGTICLKAELQRDQVHIEIRDNGIGIEADLLPHIFETFTQEQRGRGHSQGGLGLGLSLVKQLVELHRGTVTAESPGAGKGSTFTVRLPALEPERTEKPEQEQPSEINQVSPSRRVLIVDDTAGVAKITARLFTMIGHETMIALDGRTAVEKFRLFDPQIVVLDLILPDMSGFDVAREIRAMDQENRALIVAQTGNADSANRQKAQESGFDEYLVKPVDIAELKKLGRHPKLPEVGIH